MPPTTTRSPRVNRPDTRPNERRRRKTARRVQDLHAIQVRGNEGFWADAEDR